MRKATPTERRSAPISPVAGGSVRRDHVPASNPGTGTNGAHVAPASNVYKLPTAVDAPPPGKTWPGRLPKGVSSLATYKIDKRHAADAAEMSRKEAEQELQNNLSWLSYELANGRIRGAVLCYENAVGEVEVVKPWGTLANAAVLERLGTDMARHAPEVEALE